MRLDRRKWGAYPVCGNERVSTTTSVWCAISKSTNCERTVGVPYRIDDGVLLPRIQHHIGGLRSMLCKRVILAQTSTSFTRLFPARKARYV